MTPLFRRQRWPLLAVLALAICFLLYRSTPSINRQVPPIGNTQPVPPEREGLYDTELRKTHGAAQSLPQPSPGSANTVTNLDSDDLDAFIPPAHLPATGTSPPSLFPHPTYTPGIPKPSNSTYTRTLVIPKTDTEDVSWARGLLAADPHLTVAVYDVSHPTSPSDGLHAIPQNKGHEVMTYLTHIITHYHNLSDITLFMHAHAIAWHNNDLLLSSSAAIVSHLSSPHVVRQGYFNLRCHQDPGCPAHIHTSGNRKPGQPGRQDGEDDANRPEVRIFAQVWKEILPGERLPEVLSQPCCAQFAVSRERIRALPLARYEFFREWLLNTKVEDRLSGRVWEYIWQFIWMGVAELCPVESVCYCDGYGVCFGGEDKYQEYFKKRKEAREIDKSLAEKKEGGKLMEAGEKMLRGRIDLLTTEMEVLRKEAMERGEDPRNRAKEAGRPWKEGDGF